MSDKKEEKTGLEKARDTAAGLKAETEQKQEIEAANKQVALKQLDAIKANPELAQMYNDSAQAGSENIAGVSPLLKVHQTGKSSTNELADGSQPNDGWFFYKPTGEQFETIDCHILTISKGFNAESLENKKEKTFNQIMAGYIIDGAEYKPYLLYLTGKKLAPMWEFGKEATRYTHGRTLKIPLFALTVHLSTHSEKNRKGFSWIIDFKIVKDEENYPVLITDPGKFQFLKDSIEDMQATIESIIIKKTGQQELEEIKEADTYPASEDRGDIEPDEPLPWEGEAAQ